MGTKIEITEFTSEDTLVVNGNVVSGEDQAPPPPAPPPDYNHFGDHIDSAWGRSLTFRDGIETPYNTGRPLSVAAGGIIKVKVPQDEDVVGRGMTFSNPNFNEAIKFKAYNGDTGAKIAEGNIGAGSSEKITSDISQMSVVKIKFPDGVDVDNHQFSFYP